MSHGQILLGAGRRHGHKERMRKLKFLILMGLIACSALAAAAGASEPSQPQWTGLCDGTLVPDHPIGRSPIEELEFLPADYAKNVAANLRGLRVDLRELQSIF